MTTYNVDFVLAGHDHVYARSYPLTGGKGSVAYAGANILNYNTTNNVPAGAITDSALWTKTTGLLPLSNAVREQAKKPQYTIVDVAGNTVSFNTYSIDSDRSIDNFTVTK
jgi:hypothetical protein